VGSAEGKGSGNAAVLGEKKREGGEVIRAYGTATVAKISRLIPRGREGRFEPDNRGREW